MREAIPISTRLAVTLRFLATGDSYHTLYVYISYISASNIDHHTRSVPSCHKVTERICGGKQKRFIDMMSTLTNAQYNIITYIHITHIYMFHLSAINSEIPFALDGSVAVI